MGLLDTIFDNGAPVVGALDERAAMSMLGGPKAQVPQAIPRYDAGGGLDGTKILGALLAGAGGPLGALGNMMIQNDALEKQAQVKNETYNWLLKQKDPETGQPISPEMAKIIVMNKEVASQALPRLLGSQKAPDIKTIQGPYGQEQSVVWNQGARKFDPAATLFSGQPQAGSEMAPSGQSTPASPSIVPAPAQTLAPTSADQRQLPGQTGSGSASSFSPTSQAWAAAVADRQLGTSNDQPAGKPEVAANTAGDFIIGPGVPKPPQGYVQKLSPDGRGYLWNRDGTPVFESDKKADALGKADAEERTKALSAIDTARRIGEVRTLLDQPLERPYTSKGGEKYERYGDVVGPWAVPTNSSGGGGVPGQIVSALASVPSHGLQFVRNLLGQTDPEVAGTNKARNELETSLAALQSARVKELFGSTNLSDADREAAAKTVGTLTAQNADALKGQMSIGERDSYVRISRAIAQGLINRNEIPDSVITRGIELGVLPKSLAGGN